MPNEQNGQRDEVEMLAMMLLIRRFEERASQQYQAQKIGGFCHLYIGQEAVVAGAVAATRPDDYLITAYRDHAHALARGTTPDACMAELFGKATGCSRGLGGSMHYFDKANHMYGGHAIVAAHVPLAAGMAFASKYRKEDRVTLCFFGDGAINQGSFHEALNLAGLFKLPVIFICENNYFAMGTSVKRSTSLKEIVNRARGYDMPSEVVDGMSFREVRDTLEEIIAPIRKDPHPAFVEARTYRYRGHSMSDPASYRTKEELEKYRLEDPITRLRAQLTREGKLSNEEFDQLDKRAKEAALRSVKFAEESPEPPVENLYDYVFAGDEMPRPPSERRKAPAPKKAEPPQSARGAVAAPVAPAQNVPGATNEPSFSQTLRSWREKNGLSRPRASELLGVPPLTLKAWERERNKPQESSRLAVLQKIRSIGDEALRKAEPDAPADKQPTLPKAKNAEEFVENFKRWRAAQGYSRAQASRLLGVPYMTMLAWEQGKHKPTEKAQAAVLEKIESTPPPPVEESADAFVQRLKRWRELHGYDGKEAAAALGVFYGTLLSWERGSHKPSAEARAAVSKKMAASPGDETAPPPDQRFLQRLQSWREQNGLNRRQMTDILEIPEGTLASWEIGQHKPFAKTRRAILEKLQHSAEELRRRAEAEKKERNGNASESESFLAELKRWREAQNYDREQAAAALGVPFTTLRSWEMRVRKPRPEVRAALREKFAASAATQNSEP